MLSHGRSLPTVPRVHMLFFSSQSNYLVHTQYYHMPTNKRSCTNALFCCHILIIPCPRVITCPFVIILWPHYINSYSCVINSCICDIISWPCIISYSQVNSWQHINYLMPIQYHLMPDVISSWLVVIFCFNALSHALTLTISCPRYYLMAVKHKRNNRNTNNIPEDGGKPHTLGASCHFILPSHAYSFLSCGHREVMSGHVFS